MAMNPIKLNLLNQKLVTLDIQLGDYRKNSKQYKIIKTMILETLEAINDETPKELACNH
jgi:hypothetical protein